MNSNKIILIVGRENLRKDGSLNNSLFAYLEQHQFTILYEPIGSAYYHILNFEKKYIWLPNIFKKINRKICLFKYAALNFKNYYNYYKANINYVEFRSRILKQLISKMGTEKEIIIISRSAGGLIASLIADEFNIKHIICLGYPFKHPEKETEPHRFIHLKKLQTPFLIIQGKKDEYGGIETIGNYALSPSIELFFVDTDHDFKTSDDDWKNVLAKINTIINLP
ncbi:alpha/beta family hydrolase [Flavobacterium sp. 83]|uniref:alpha/beta family hydrolase n=1 Tax=Flavobacterium sp. 83 TaxID=1131812 RepID=UPI00068DF84D|nr:alpha/beta family hydrolase [Flavobacterium sp. 83]